MEKIIKELTLDVTRENGGISVNAKQNDVSSRFIKARITSDRRAVRLPSDGEVLINALREDGGSGGFVGEINDDGTVTVPITQWMLAVSGTVKCDISVFDGWEKLTTMPFFIYVEESLYDGEAMDNEETYTLLSTVTSTLQTMNTEEAKRDSAEAERAFSEIARETAETLRETNEATRIAAEEKRTTYVPFVSEEGVISWTNDKGLDNPAPVLIKGRDGVTPVKGTDYWTEEDKTEIVNAVLNALPSAEGVEF